jgi:hypothetical protein
MKKEYKIDVLIEELYNGIVDSGLVNNYEIEQLARNLADDVRDIPVVLSKDQLLEGLDEIYNYGSGTNNIKDMISDIYFENNDMAMLIHKELSYWISHGNNKS